MNTTADTATYAPILSPLENRKRSLQVFIKPVEFNPLFEKTNLLKRFLNVGENWDGYGAKAPRSLVINNAINFIGALPFNYQKTLNLEEINLTPYGTVVMEWFRDQNNYISFEIGATKIGYLTETLNGENPYSEGEEITTDEVSGTILEIFKTVFATK